MVKTLLDKSRTLLSRQSSSILSAALIIAVSYLLSAGLGLIRNRLLAARFFGGAESALDVYFAAFVIPDSIFQLLVVGALSAAFIPVYSRYLKRGDEQANHLVNATLNLLLLFLLLIVILLFVFALPVSNLISNFSPPQALLMSNLMRIMLISQLFFTVSTFLTGILQSHQRFLIPAIAPLFYNFGIILGIIFLTPSLGIYGAGFGVIIGALLHMLVQIPLSLRLGFRYQLLLDFGHEGVANIRRLMIPRTAALAVIQLERWNAVFIASIFSAGSLTLFNFARQLYSLPISLFGVSLGQASFPTLSAQIADNNHDQFKKTLSHSLLQILFFSLPATALLLVLRLPVVRLVFGARNFPWEATLLTGKTLALLSLSIAPQAISQVLVRAFYALHNTKTPFLVSLATVILHLALSFFLAVTLNTGILGLSLGTTIANTLSIIMLLILLEKKLGRLYIYADTLKMLLATTFTAIFLWGPMRLLDQFVFDTTRTFPLLLLTGTASLIGLLVYFTLSFFLKIPQLTTVITLLQRLGNWRRILHATQEVIETHPGNGAQ